MKEANELRTLMETGEVKEAFDYLKEQWAFERGERMVAKVGDEEQEYEFIMMRSGGKEVKVRKKGWRDIFRVTGLARWDGPDGVIGWLILADGGAGQGGKLEGARIFIGLEKEGTNLTKGKAIVIEDDSIDLFDGEEKPKWREMIVRIDDKVKGALDEGVRDMANILDEDEREWKNKHHWLKRRKEMRVSALDKIEGILSGVKIGERRTTEVSLGA